MKTWEIYHYTYKDVCGDSWYGKKGEFEAIGFVTDTEDNVKSLVNKLNVNNHSYYAKDEPENEWDSDFLDEDYFSYTELKIVTIEAIENNLVLNTYRHQQDK